MLPGCSIEDHYSSLITGMESWWHEVKCPASVITGAGSKTDASQTKFGMQTLEQQLLYEKVRSLFESRCGRALAITRASFRKAAFEADEKHSILP